VRGGGRYTDDVQLPGMTYGVVLRSPHARAKINSIDTAAAKAAPGVLSIITGADWKDAGFGDLTSHSGLKRRDGRLYTHPAYRKRGFTADEASAAAVNAESAARHGIKTHNAIKAIHLDEHLGSKAGGCNPGAKIEKLPTKFKAVGRWNANRKLGQAVALEAMSECMRLADEFGIGIDKIKVTATSTGN
jgi:xanthine dehydrogenase molybdopterin-binding subunit B